MYHNMSADGAARPNPDGPDLEPVAKRRQLSKQAAAGSTGRALKRAATGRWSI